MICNKCKKEFEEKDIQESHDIPEYMDGTDLDGRHQVCVKCHDIYEKICFSLAWKRMPDDLKKEVHNDILNFCRRWYND